jgi:tetratricopeptide (TPR) repeat protein
MVALKRVVPCDNDSAQMLARFRREAETAARLDHPNIIPIYHVGETSDGFPFFTMKYAMNGSLLHASDLLKTQPRKCVALIAKVANAVQYAHEQGVLHRDLKPGNILLDCRDEPLVSDFGLARCEMFSVSVTRSFTSLGTPGYIAPEQAAGPASQLTFAADVYSLGAILFELLSGRLPFVGDTALAIIQQSIDKAAPKLRTIASHLDRGLETICARCLEREPKARYPSAGALVGDLLNWLDDRPIVARPIGVWHRTTYWLRRNHLVATLSFALVVLTVVAVGWRIHVRELQTLMRESVLASRSALILPTLDLDEASINSTIAESFGDLLRAQLKTLGPARLTAASLPPRVYLGESDHLRKVGLEAKSRTILTSTVRKIQGKMCVSFRLLDTTSGEALFTYLSTGKTTTDLITSEFARGMYAILSAKDPSNILKTGMDSGLRNEIAKEAITAAKSIVLSSAADCDKAIALLKKAIGAEPRSVLAHSYLAMTAADRIHFNGDPTFVELAKVEASKAINLSPSSSDAHRAMAAVHYQEGKYSEALGEQLRTIENGGLEHKIGCFVGLTLDTLGRPDQALRWYGLVSQFGTTVGNIDGVMGDCWARLNADEEARKAYGRAAELRPDLVQGAVGMSHLQLLTGDFDGARKSCPIEANQDDALDAGRLAAEIEFFGRLFGQAEELYKKLELADRGGGGWFYGAITYRSALGRIRQALGDIDGATVILRAELAKEAALLARQPENAEAAYRLAGVEASLGLVDGSLEHLGQAIRLGWIDYRSLKLDPRFDALRARPELEGIIEDVAAKVGKMNLEAGSQTRRGGSQARRGDKP